jgi:tight adherence protein B
VTILIAIFFGLAAALAAWGGRDWLWRRYQTDLHWLQTTWLRFNPALPNVSFVLLGVYSAYLVALLLLLAIIPSTLVALLVWGLLLILPKLLIEGAWARRRRKIDLQLPASITSMANSIRAGLTLVQALQRLAEQSPEPIRTEYRVMANRYAFGADLESTIREAKDRLGLQNFNLFASALLLNREMGGDVADTLDRISRSLEKLQQMRKTVEAHTAEGRTNIKVLLVAPVVMLLMIAAVDSPGVELLFTTPQGRGVLLVAGALILAGVYFASRITRSEV